MARRDNGAAQQTSLFPVSRSDPRDAPSSTKSGNKPSLSVVEPPLEKASERLASQGRRVIAAVSDMRNSVSSAIRDRSTRTDLYADTGDTASPGVETRVVSDEELERFETEERDLTEEIERCEDTIRDRMKNFHEPDEVQLTDEVREELSTLRDRLRNLRRAWRL